MAVEVILPRQGQSVETCRILSWRKQEGEPVKAGETLCEVETDKAVFEVESPADGILLKIFHPEGEDVEVLSRLAAVGAPGEALSEQEPERPATADKPRRAPVISSEEEPAARQSTATPGGRGISPRARRLAGEKGLRIDNISGSGPGGRIIERDVAAALSRRQTAGRAREGEAPAPTAPGAAFPGPWEDIFMRGVRKIIAERMLASARSTAQYTLYATAAAENILTARAGYAGGAAGADLTAVTLNDMLLYVVSRVLPGFPLLNSHHLEDRIRSYGQVHLGFAVDTPRGLMVPVIRDAAALSLPQLSRRARELSEACRQGRAAPDDLTGGTFTVSNLGSLGVESFSPILNPPEVGILGVGAVVFRHVQDENGILLQRRLSLSLTVDHRVVDGAPAAEFLSALGKAIGGFAPARPGG